MSTDDQLKIEPFPTGTDPDTGAALIGTVCYSIMGAELTIDHQQYGSRNEIWYTSFHSGQHGAAKIALAAPAVFIVCAEAFRVQEAHLNDLYSKLRSQQEQIAELEKRLRDVELGGAPIH